MSVHRAPGIPPARKAALECVWRVLDHGQDIQAAVDYIFRTMPLTDKDQGLATELSYGLIRHRTRLEHMVRFYQRKPDPLEQKLERVLCLAAYELHFLDRVPAYASVNWAVEYIKQNAGAGVSRMANAVLRNIDREKSRWARPANLLDAPLKVWSIYFSIPLWMLELLSRQYNRNELLFICEAQSRPPTVGLRFNWRKPQAQDLYCTLKDAHPPVLTLPAGLAYESGTVPDISQALKDGLVSRQSIAGQEMLYDMNFRDWPEPIYDATAGRGGKTCFLSEQGKVVWAGDTSLVRLRGLGSEFQRLGLASRPFNVLADATCPAPFSKTPGTFFLDVPCSGLGVLSRRPDIKWHRDEKSLPQLLQLQNEILFASAAQLIPGGVLVYMTCTLNKDENGKRIEELLAKNKEVVLEKESLTPLDTRAGEFFYGARLQRKN